MGDKPTFKVGDVVEVFADEAMDSLAAVFDLPRVPSLLATVVGYMDDETLWLVYEDASYANPNRADGRSWTPVDWVRPAPSLSDYASRMIAFMSTQQRNFFETSIRPFVRAILFRHAPTKAKKIALERTGYDGREWLAVDALNNGGSKLTIGETFLGVVRDLTPFILPYLNDGETLVLTSIGDKQTKEE